MAPIVEIICNNRKYMNKVVVVIKHYCNKWNMVRFNIETRFIIFVLWCFYL